MTRANHDHRSSPGEPRRFVTRTNQRYRVVVEAARLLYTRQFKEYFQAKREAARRLRCTILPTNQEIHHHLLLIAEAKEGPERSKRLREMRVAALETMQILEAFRPRLIGSVWTGHIRVGSDIDLHLYGNELGAVTRTLKSAGLSPKVRRVRSQGEQGGQEFLHVGLTHPSGFEVETTLYQESDYDQHPGCSISGGPMARGSIQELRAVLEAYVEEPADHGDVGPDSELQESLIAALDVDKFLSLLPELRACIGVEQNHFQHTDVFHHTLEVVDELQRMQRSGFDILGKHGESLRHHLQSQGPGKWDRFALLILAALCHDIGKPRTKSRHKSGQIRFPGHDAVGASKSRELAERLGLQPATAEALEVMVALHMAGVRLSRCEPKPSELYHLFRDAQTLLPELMLLSLADIAAARGPAQPSYRYEEQICFCKEMLEEYFMRGFLRFPNLPVSAMDLQTELGVTDTQLTRALLERLTQGYVDDEFQGREDGLAWASELLETPSELW